MLFYVNVGLLLVSTLAFHVTKLSVRSSSAMNVEKSINRITLLGRVGQDPVIRKTPNGDQMAYMSFATSENWTDKVDGHYRQRTEWHQVSIFERGIVQLVSNFVRKGTRLLLEGKVAYNAYEDDDGKMRVRPQVIVGKGHQTGFVILGHKYDGQGGEAEEGAPNVEEPPNNLPELPDLA
eukprot:GHVL01040396.1.p1 GENE.GHVL01040396.1~~GHVL01040396.1.p1  ORF type:complete len:179 (+),score=13.05 GHVL01040396.1:52-588(+)